MAWVLDLDGVVWLGDTPIPGAAAAIGRLRAAGERVAFVTNNSYGRRSDVAAKLTRHGIDPGDDVVTSAVVAAGLVRSGERALVCGGPGIVEELSARGVEVVDASAPEATEGRFDVVVVGYHPTFDYHRMDTASAAVRAGARLLATNDDATYPMATGIKPGGGAILASDRHRLGRDAGGGGQAARAGGDWVRRPSRTRRRDGRGPTRHRRPVRPCPRLPLRAGAERRHHRGRPAHRSAR